MHESAQSNTHKLSLNNLLTLYVLGGLLLAALVGYFGIRTFYINAQETKALIAQVEADIDALEQLQADTEELRKNYKEVEKQRDQILSLLPDENKEEDLLVLLNQIATKNGVIFSNFSPETVVVSDDEGARAYTVYAVSVNVTGTNENLVTFLRELEDSSRFVEVVSSNASSSGTLEEADPTISLRLDLQAYYRTAGDDTASDSEAGES